MRGIRFIPDNTAINFVKLRIITFVLSVLMVLATCGGFYKIGINYGIDFSGGTSILVKTSEKADMEALRATVGSLGLGDVSLQEFGSPQDVRIRIEQQKSKDGMNANEAQNAAVVLVKNALNVKEKLEPGEKGIVVLAVESVGPTVGEELIESGIYAVLLALLAMALYIWIRFEWQFGICALLALTHDCVSIMALYVFTSLEFNLDAIVAILITAGYSINDTVVVYDRIRENLRKYKAMPIRELINKSINETLSRTVLTSGTTLMALLSLYYFGGQVIANYSLPIICGVAVGTYSSICIAAPLLLFFNVKARKEKKDTEPEATS